MREELRISSSKKWWRSESFTIQKPDLRIAWTSLLLIVGYFIVGELFFRVESIQAALTEPILGSRHRQFEIQWGRLDRLVKAGVPIDCIFLGNSMTWLGVNPLLVDQVFERKTGQEIHCFNFGVSALPASTAGMLAPLLVERYHPKLLIYGTFARDYAIPADAEDAVVISEAPWLDYQRGNFNLTGWAYANSHVLQYKGHMHDFLYMSDDDDLFLHKKAPDYQAYGLDPKYDIRLDVRQSPDFESPNNRDPVTWLTHYTIKQENLDGLRTVVEQSNRGVQVIVIEMPFYETALEFFTNGERDYDMYIKEVDQIAADSGTVFWRLADQPVIAPENWWDYFHLNLSGVNIFSEWLGDQLADSYLQGTIQLVSRKNP
jgi:hypothetical protein